MTNSKELEKAKLSLKSLYNLAAKSVPIGSDQIKVHEDFSHVARYLTAHNPLLFQDVVKVWKDIQPCLVYQFGKEITVRVSGREIVRLSIEEDICVLSKEIGINELKAICVTLRYLEEQMENNDE